MVKPDMIVRSNRRSISLTINKFGQVIVRAPKRLSMEYIVNFVKEKEKWIDRKLKEIDQNKTANQNIIEYKTFLFLGKEYKRLDVNGIKKIELTNNNLIIPTSVSDERLNNALLKWHLNMCKDIITARVEYFANLMHLNYTKLGYMNNKSRWGSCSKDDVIKLNLRIVMLPHRVIDYVIVHELAHLIEFNHSPKFYKLVESVMPDYKKQRNTLKSYGYLLELYR